MAQTVSLNTLGKFGISRSDVATVMPNNSSRLPLHKFSQSRSQSTPTATATLESDLGPDVTTEEALAYGLKMKEDRRLPRQGDRIVFLKNAPARFCNATGGKNACFELVLAFVYEQDGQFVRVCGRDWQVITQLVFADNHSPTPELVPSREDETTMLQEVSESWGFDENGLAVVRLRVNDVSRNHDGRDFKVSLSIDMSIMSLSYVPSKDAGRRYDPRKCPVVVFRAFTSPFVVISKLPRSERRAIKLENERRAAEKEKNAKLAKAKKAKVSKSNAKGKTKRNTIEASQSRTIEAGSR